MKKKAREGIKSINMENMILPPTGNGDRRWGHTGIISKAFGLINCDIVSLKNHQSAVYNIHSSKIDTTAQ